MSRNRKIGICIHAEEKDILWPGTLNARTRNGLESTISPRKRILSKHNSMIGIGTTFLFVLLHYEHHWDLIFLNICVFRNHIRSTSFLAYLMLSMSSKKWMVSIVGVDWEETIFWDEWIEEELESLNYEWRHMLLLKDFAPQHYILVSLRRESHICTSLYTHLQPPPLFSFKITRDVRFSLHTTRISLGDQFHCMPGGE